MNTLNQFSPSTPTTSLSEYPLATRPSARAPGDEDEIVELLRLVFNVWPHLDLNCAPLEHWRWKYKDQPNKKSFITVAVCDGKIIGCHHAIQVGIKIGKNILPCTITSDFAVHPDFRKIGISKMMGVGFSRGWRKREGMIFDYCIIGNPILIKSFSNTRPRARDFLDSRIKLNIFCTPSNDKGILKKIVQKSRQVYLSWGDHDVLPAQIPS